MVTRELFEVTCQKKLEEMGLADDPRYIKRLAWEFGEINAKGKHDYFWSMHEKKVRYPLNQNNLLVCKLLGICQEYKIENDPNCEYGEYPDIDIDYLDIVRDYLKTDWAKRIFGEDYICNIGNYTTFKIKSALIDMARVHSESREEIQAITKNLDDKDDEGKAITWDAAMKLYPDLKKYCDEHKDVAEAARRLLNRNRGMGVHAGGLIISNQPLHDLVPLVKRKDNPQASAWVEGLHGQDLGPVGLVKFDLLVINNLLQIAKCCKLVKERHNLPGICALPGQSDWTDVAAWRDDQKALAMADKGDLKGIFQFDKDAVRTMARRGGVTRFEDLVAYTSLNRPGCLGANMDKRYIERKRGREKYALHPLLKPILDKTYGVMVFQEDIMKMLYVVGEIPLKDCELVRKAISKKKVEGFAKYKDMFINNGQKNLQVDESEINNLWNQIESWAEYGFNKSVLIGTLIPTIDCGKNLMRRIEDFVPGDVVYCVDKYGSTEETEVIALHDHGILDAYEVVFDDGYSVTCTLNHKFLTEKGQKSLQEIIGTNYNVLCDSYFMKEKYAEEKCGWMEGSMWSVVGHQSGVVDTFQGMPGVSSKILYDGGVDSQVWNGVQNAYTVEETSGGLSELSEIGMEAERNRWTNCCHSTGCSMRSDIGYLQDVGGTSEKLFKVSENKAKEHYCKEYKVESVGVAAEGFVENGKDNFGQTGNSTSKSGEVANVARSQPGKVRQVYRSGMAVAKTVEDGNLAAIAIENLGDGSNSVWKGAKASGFCEWENLDRSGWILSFQRKSAYRKQAGATVVGRCPGQGCNAQRRGEKAWKCDVDSSEHGVFCEFDGSDEARMVGLAAGHAEIRDTGRLVRRKIVRVMSVGKRQMYDLEVANSTHNFLLPNGVVTSNSHATAYTYISARLLWLKAHYPHEFYTAILSCETLAEKMKEYKIEAFVHSVNMHQLDINKSKLTFDLVDDTIYFGLSNVKGIGEEPAKRILAGQPYKGIEDFLHRFGTDANVLKPLIGLRCFREADPVTLWKFAEYYKDKAKKCEDKKKRFASSMVRYQEQFEELTGMTVKMADLEMPNSGKNPFDNEEWRSKFDIDEEIEVDKEIECEEGDEGAEARTETVTVLIEGTEDEYVEKGTQRWYKMGKVKKKYNKWKNIVTLWNRYQKAIQKREESPGLALPKLSEFNAAEWDIDDELVKELRHPVKCETKYYGFAWVHDLEKSPDYKGNMTFEQFRSNPDLRVSPVEVKLLKVSKRDGKKTQFYQVECEDASNEFAKFNVWLDDWQRWGPELKKGNLLRVRLMPPSGGFPTYTFDSPPKHQRWKLPKSKDEDFRLVVMRPGKEQVDDVLTNEEALEQFSECVYEE